MHPRQKATQPELIIEPAPTSSCAPMVSSPSTAGTLPSASPSVITHTANITPAVFVPDAAGPATNATLVTSTMAGSLAPTSGTVIGTAQTSTFGSLPPAVGEIHAPHMATTNIQQLLQLHEAIQQCRGELEQWFLHQMDQPADGLQQRGADQSDSDDMSGTEPERSQV